MYTKKSFRAGMAAVAAAMAVAVAGGWTGAGAQFVKNDDGYSVTHSAGSSLSEWQKAGARPDWQISGGGLSAPNNNGNQSYFTLKPAPATFTCEPNGTYEVTLGLASDGQHSNASAIVFRYTDTTHFYAIRIRYNYDNYYYPLLFSKNTLYAQGINAAEKAIGSDFTSSSGKITVKVELKGDSIKISRDGTYLGAVVDSDNKSGQVGYAQASNWERNLVFYSSSWKNAALPTYTLTTTANPPAGGTLSRSPTGTSYTSGTSVTVTATPASGYEFTGWSGDTSGTTKRDTTITVTMNAAKSLTANFRQIPTTYLLTTNVIPAATPAAGTLVRSPTGTSYSSGTSVTVTATAATGYTFTGWSGDTSGTTRSGTAITVTMNAAKSLTANFQQSQTTTTYILTTSVTPAGGGSVSRSPNGTSYDAGTSVTVTATPTSGYTFTGWSGDTSGTTKNGTAITVTMNAAKSLTANFQQSQTTTYTLTATASPAAGGTVTLNPVGPTYASGATVTVTAAANSGYTFTGWSGASTATTASVQIVMNGDKTLTAIFQPSTPTTLYTITFDPAGGTVTPTSAQTGADGKLAANPPTPTRAGYTFNGWTRANGTAVSTSTVFTSNETITAQWSELGASVTANPLTVEAGLDSSTSGGVWLKLYVMGQAALPTNGEPRVDSVGIWYKRGGGEWTAAALSGNALVKGACAGADSLLVYSLAALKTSGGNTIPFRTGKVTDPSGENLYFAIAPRWKGSGLADTIARPLYVSSITVQPPVASSIDNPVKLVMSQADRRKNTVSVTVSDTGGLDNLADTVLVKASFASSMSNTISTKTISKADVSKTGGFTYTIENDSFAGEERRVYFEWSVSGKDVGSSANKANFIVGRRPPTPVSNLSASPGQSGSVDLSWSTPTAAGNGLGDLTKAKIRIYYSDKEILADADTSKLTFVREIPANTNTANKAENVPGLTLNRDYWFAVVLIDVVDGNPAATLRSPAATCKGNTGSGSVVVNIFEITAAAFNDTSMAFTATVKLTAAGQANYKYGYFVMLGADTTVKAASKDLNATAAGATFQITTAAVGGELMFDTAYTFHVYLIDDKGSASRTVFADVKTGGFKSQKVVVKKDSTGSFDNGKFKVGTAGWGLTELDPCTTTVTASNTPADNLISDRGFIPIGAYGYSYRVASKDLPVLGVSNKAFKISMSAPDGIPSAYSGAYSDEDVRLYRWSGQYWEVLHDTKYDSATGYYTGTALGNVQAESNSGSYVYRLLISTRRPSVNLGNAGSGGYKEDRNANEGDIIEKYSITCNVGNFKAYMLSGPATGAAVLDSAEATDGPASGETRALTFTINDGVLENSESSGILAFLIVADGHIADTINVTHRVSSPNYRGFRAEDEMQYKWRPFAAQVELANRGIKKTLGPLFYQDYQEDADIETYDTLFRLFRWHYTSENSDKNDKWVEYNGKNGDDFDMNPGRLMWFRTSDETTASNLDFGGAKTISLREAFTIALPPGQWTDFVLPFQFNVCLGDILDSTSVPREGNNALEIYRWAIPGNKSKQQYLTEPQFSDSAELMGGSNPFTVFNPGKDTVKLRIPPRPAFMSRYGRSGKLKRLGPPALLSKAAAGAWQGAPGSWHYTLRVGTADADLPSVFVGYSAVEKAFAVPPGFGNESMVLVDDNGAEFGHHFGPAIAGGGTYRLRFYNDGRQKATFAFSAQPSADAPFGPRVTFVKASTGEMLGGRGFEQSITVAAMSSEDVFMLIGGNGYRAKAAATTAGAKFTVAPISVNMAARSARISYFVPENGVERVEVAVYDIKGRQAWKNVQIARAAAWNTMEWNSRQGRGVGASTGLYFVRVKALGPGGKTVGVSGKRITFAR